MKKNSEELISAAQPTHEQVAIRAELLWKAQGSPTGRDEQIWLEAERQLFEETREVTSSAEKSSQEDSETAERQLGGSAEQMIAKRATSGTSKRRSSAGR